MCNAAAAADSIAMITLYLLAGPLTFVSLLELAAGAMARCICSMIFCNTMIDGRNWGVCAQWGGQVWRFAYMDNFDSAAAAAAATAAVAATAATSGIKNDGGSRRASHSQESSDSGLQLQSRMMVGQYGVSIRRQLRPPTFVYIAAAAHAVDSRVSEKDGACEAADCEWMFVSAVTSGESLTAVHVRSGCLFDLTPALGQTMAPSASSFSSASVNSSSGGSSSSSSSSSCSSSSSSSRDSEIIGLSGIGDLLACVRNKSVTLFR